MTTYYNRTTDFTLSTKFRSADLNAEFDGVETAFAAVASAVDAAALSVTTAGSNTTSTTSNTIGTGSKTWTVETGKSLVVGMTYKMAETATPSNWALGTITAYNSSTGSLTITVTDISGSGTITAWTGSVSAPITRGMTRRAITSADTIVAGDFGGVIDVTSGTFSLAVTAVASLPSGFWTIVRNSSTAGVVTIDPNSSETIGGASTLILYPKQAALIYVSGSNLDYLSLEQPAIGVVSSAAASGSSVVLTPAALRNATYRIVIGQVTTSGAANIQLNGNNLCTNTSAESNFIIDAYFDSSGNAACVSHGEIGAGGERTVYVPLTSPTTLTVAPSSGTFSGGTITFIRLT